MDLLSTSDPIPLLPVVPERWFEPPESYCKFELAICFTYGSVCVSMLLSPETCRWWLSLKIELLHEKEEFLSWAYIVVWGIDISTGFLCEVWGNHEKSGLTFSLVLLAEKVFEGFMLKRLSREKRENEEWKKPGLSKPERECKEDSLFPCPRHSQPWVTPTSLSPACALTTEAHSPLCKGLWFPHWSLAQATSRTPYSVSQRARRLSQDFGEVVFQTPGPRQAPQSSLCSRGASPNHKAGLSFPLFPVPEHLW